MPRKTAIKESRGGEIEQISRFFKCLQRSDPNSTNVLGDNLFDVDPYTIHATKPDAVVMEGELIQGAL